MPVLYYLHNISWTVQILDKKINVFCIYKTCVFENMILSAPKEKKLSQKSFLTLTRYTQYEEQRLKAAFMTVMAFWKTASSHACNQQRQRKGGETILADTMETC